jgi:hypothetical protein
MSRSRDLYTFSLLPGRTSEHRHGQSGGAAVKHVAWIPVGLVSGFLAGFGVDIGIDLLPLLAVSLLIAGFYLASAGHIFES